MSLTDFLTQQKLDDSVQRVIDGQLFYHHSILHKWEKNEEYRLIKEKGWTRLLKSLKKNGVKQAFEIDEQGTIYDGNNRFEGLKRLLEQGVTTADNGKDLQWIPVHVNPVPQNEVEALAIAVKGNGDKDFAFWNKDATANHQDLFEQIPDYGDMVIDIDEAYTFSDEFEVYTGGEEIDPKEKEVKEDACESCSVYHANNHQITQPSDLSV